MITYPLIEALTFDDVLLMPGYSSILPKDVSLKTRLTRHITLNIPLVSAAMDTVTESRLAIALAQEGGIGIIHKNMSIEQQAKEVRKVKKFESGMVKDPITVPPETTVRELLAITSAHNFSGVPVVQGDQLVGIVTSRDVRFETNMNLPITQIMTPKERLITVKEGASHENIIELLHKHRIEKVLVVNDNFKLMGLVTVKDIQKANAHPDACKDEHAQLRVGAAVGVGKSHQQRMEALIQAGVDVIVIDTAHGHSQSVLEQVRWLKQQSFASTIDIIVGNIATAGAASALADAGADAVKVGIGPGSICTTRIIAGIGVPQITAIAEAAKGLSNHPDIPLIADGGIRFSGDIAKALAAGAHTIMIGNLFAGTDESPGEIELYQGRTYKNYRGMGSLGAMAQKDGSSDRYFQEHQSHSEKLVPEGIEGRLPYKGPLGATVHQMTGGLRASMGYMGCTDIADIHKKAQLIKVTSAGMRESHAHDVHITKQAPNYQITDE